MKIKKILIVEDEALNAYTFQLFLKKSGYIDTSITSSGEEAVKEALSNPPDLILMDIRLGGKLDGIDAIKQIREVIDVPVIFLTGYTEKSLMEKADELNPLAYLVKPVNFNDLKALIESSEIEA
jgi:CheY-like chemotaxis protein